MIEVCQENRLNNVVVHGFMADNARAGWNTVWNIFWGGLHNPKRERLDVFIFFSRSIGTQRRESFMVNGKSIGHFGIPYEMQRRLSKHVGFLGKLMHGRLGIVSQECWGCFKDGWHGELSDGDNGKIHSSGNFILNFVSQQIHFILLAPDTSIVTRICTWYLLATSGTNKIQILACTSTFWF